MKRSKTKRKAGGHVATSKTARAPRVHVDLTLPDDQPVAAPPAAAGAAAAGPHKWQRWLYDPVTRARRQEEYELLEYKRSIEDLWHRLCHADIPIPMGDVMSNLDAFASCAIKLLYLLSHAPWEYRHLRDDTGLFIEAIEAWGDENVPRARTQELIVMVMNIHNSANQHLFAAHAEAAAESAERPAGA